MSGSGTMTVLDIQKLLGISRNQAKSMMKKHRVDHDGSEEMRFPAGITADIINKEKERISRASKKRQEISENRKEKRNNKAQDIISDREMANFLDIPPSEVKAVRTEFSLTVEPLPRQLFSNFLDAGGKQKVASYLPILRREKEMTNRERKAEDSEIYMSQSEICQHLNIDRYDIKVAVKSGLLQSVNKKFLRKDIMGMDVEEFKKALIWERHHPTPIAGRCMGVTEKDFEELAEKYSLQPVGATKDGSSQLWRYGDFHFLIGSEELNDIIAFNRSQEDGENEEENFDCKDEAAVNEAYRICDNIQVRIRNRQKAPDYVALHLGPTNSGKTYNALENLCDEYEKNPAGRYVYAGPLRMLAFEVYEKLVERYGVESVGFLTGEEQVNPSAPILASTVEMAPAEGDVLIIDEAHWIIDDERGHYWTNLLVGGSYSRIHVIAAREVKDDVLPLVKDARKIESFGYQRRTGITFEGTIPLEKVPAKTAVVCFSRKSVYAMAGALRDVGKNVGVLYGALPLHARKEQIRKFVAGEFDVMVTTDVIGHGINLPIDNVVFAETEKFDGKIRRDLHSWEAGQIAGRAGRFGLSDKGRVYLVSGRQWFSVDSELVKQGVAVASGMLPSDLDVDKPFMAPRFPDLGLLEADQINLNYAVEIWKSSAEPLLGAHGIKPSALETLVKNLEAVAFAVDCYLNKEDVGRKVFTPNGLFILDRKGSWKMDIEHLWQLVSGPFAFDSPVLEATARWLNEGAPRSSTIMEECFRTTIAYGAFFAKDDMECLEKASQANGEMKMAALMFASEDGMLGTFNVHQLVKAERSINTKIVKLLAADLKGNGLGTCTNCGDECAPWFEYCEICFGKR